MGKWREAYLSVNISKGETEKNFFFFGKCLTGDDSCIPSLKRPRKDIAS